MTKKTIDSNTKKYNNAQKAAATKKLHRMLRTVWQAKASNTALDTTGLEAEARKLQALAGTWCALALYMGILNAAADLA